MKANIYIYQGLDFVIVDETEKPNIFKKWLDGQSVPEVPDVDAAYLWDYQRWLREKQVNQM